MIKRLFDNFVKFIFNVEGEVSPTVLSLNRVSLFNFNYTIVNPQPKGNNMKEGGSQEEER